MDFGVRGGPVDSPGSDSAWQRGRWVCGELPALFGTFGAGGEDGGPTSIEPAPHGGIDSHPPYPPVIWEVGGTKGVRSQPLGLCFFIYRLRVWRGGWRAGLAVSDTPPEGWCRAGRFSALGWNDVFSSIQYVFRLYSVVFSVFSVVFRCIQMYSDARTFTRWAGMNRTAPGGPYGQAARGGWSWVARGVWVKEV